MKTVSAVAVVLFLLSGCAIPTAYQPVAFTGGYSDTQLADNIFEVNFRGNGFTSRERATDFALLRSAEITLQHGFRYFTIVQSEKGARVGAFTTPTTSYTNGSAYATGNQVYGSATTTTYGGQTFLITKPRSSDTIVCFKEKPTQGGLVFDARFIAHSIRHKYQMK